MKETFYNGAQGNLSLHVATVTLAALAQNDTVKLMENLPVGTEITGVRNIAAALGASSAYKVDLVDKAGGSTALLASTTSTSATSGIKPLKPIYIGDQGVSDVVLTSNSTGAATGEVTFAIEYRFKGY
jgi:hypothetical protein